MRLPVLLCLFTLYALPAHAAGLFTDAERSAIVAYWNTPGRMHKSIPIDAKLKGLWQVRLTPEASAWFLKYQIATGAAAAPPTQDPTSHVPPIVAWKAWVNRKLTYDRWQAQDWADSANIAVGIIPTTPPMPPPPFPGPVPPDLLAATGNPPAFAAAVTPTVTTVTFEDGEFYDYTDQVRVPTTYAYFRFPQGTVFYGSALGGKSDSELAPLFAAAGFDSSEQRVATAVSRLEGDFESINTYDSGYVSVGFIQFISSQNGNASLLSVLAREKADDPVAFASDFHGRGIDLDAGGVLVAVDPDTGAELTGALAVSRIIADRRLTATFQRAGRHSSAFRIAQIKVARAEYWPGVDPVQITVNGQVWSGKVSDIVKSEAGMATLFDRKVNRGTIKPFADVVTRVMQRHHLSAVSELAPYEREIIQSVRYRTDFLKDKTISQPP